MKLVAATLSICLILSAPGLAPYQALAVEFEMPAAPEGGRPTPLTPPVIQSVDIPKLGPGVEGVPLTGDQTVVPNPTATADQTAQQQQTARAAEEQKKPEQTTLAAGQILQSQITAQRNGGGDGKAPLDDFYKGKGADEKPGAPTLGATSDNPSGLQPSGTGNGGGSTRGPIDDKSHPELFAPRSSRVGVGPLKYVYWNAFYNFMQWLNLKLARDPNRRVSWDKWPTKLGLAYLIAKIRFVRSDTLTDPYDYAANDVKPAGKEPEQVKRGYTADGSWVSDRENPRMGAENTRFGSNIPPQKVRPDVENLMLKAREIGKIKWRKLDENGKPVVRPAGILNDLAGGWIQFQFHNFGGNTKRDPIAENPHKVEMPAKEGWAEKEMVVDRTSKDPTRVTDNGRPTIMNERTQAWIQAQIYGTNEAELGRLRAYQGGKMKLGVDGRLPEDPSKPGIDLSGFVNNYNPLLSFLHWAFVVNHNNLADHYRYFHPDWDDDTIFDYARKANVASIDMIHTVEWTEDLLQHPTLQAGMHAEFYGLLGPKLKAWLMRFSYRHPWFAKLIKPISNNDVIWGMPGSKWEHHDGPFQVPKHFRMVYRLHEMVLDEHEFIEPGTNRSLGRVDLINFVHNNTRPIVEKYGYDTLAYSFVKKSAGALVPHNFPRALTQFKNQQNGQLTDLAMLDIFREMTDGTGSYNEFRRSVGEPPVKSFMELTGGDAELAKELELKFDGDIEAVTPGIGILAEPKPAGFALGFTQFYQFVLNAPRRVKSNRHLTEYFTHKDYTFEGMEWVLNGGGMGGVIARAMKTQAKGQAVIDSMEGVTRWFAPWPDAETFPVRMLDKTAEDSGKILRTQLVTLGLGAAAAVSAILAGILVSPAMIAIFLAPLAPPLLLYYERMLAWRYMQKTWQSAYTDRRRSMFPTLFKGEKWARRSYAMVRTSSKVVMVLAGLLAYGLWSSNPVTAALVAGVALSTFLTRSAAKGYLNDMQVLKIALQSRLREGYPVVTDASSLPGKTALERRYWFLVPKSQTQPVARLVGTYRALHEHGLGRLWAFKTALLSHLLFGWKTQRGLGLKGRWKAGVLFNPFAIYLPNLVQAQGLSSTRVYAPIGNKKGLTPGDVDLEEFDRMLRTWAPGRDYLTAYDFGRMREGIRFRAAQEGLGNPVTRWASEFFVQHRVDQLMELYADRVANEDKVLVPAISRDMLLRVYQGTAQADIQAERALDGVHPDLRTPNPLTADGKPTKLSLRERLAQAKKIGWKAVVGIVLFYLVRDLLLYVVIPYLMYKGVF